jgi:addiction module HigA family antidote
MIVSFKWSHCRGIESVNTVFTLTSNFESASNEAIHVPYQRINELVNRRRGVTPGTALRLGKFFGMSAELWLNLQVRWDLYKAQQAEAAELEAIRDFHHYEKTA